MIKRSRIYIVLILLLLGFPGKGFLQEIDSAKGINKHRMLTTSLVGGVGYVGSMVILNEAWYKNYPRTGFHTFNDNDEWLQMDKFGHAMSAYYLGDIGHSVFRWTGIKEKQAIWIGGSVGLIYLTSIEMLDAFSAEWGFSWGDMAANTLGTGLFVGQQLGWGEQRIKLKYSAHLTNYAPMRPEVLGANLPERLLKDYNGQTYWLSANIKSFLPEDSKFPSWINFSVGYGAESMTSGHVEPIIDPINLDRHRQYYASLDIDFTKIKTRHKFVKGMFKVLSFVKVPFPALEFSNQGSRFHLLYF